MTARRFLPLGLVMLTLALTLAACDGGRKRPPETTVRVLNVAPSFLSLDYLREETTPSNLEFRSGTVFQYDEDTYDFNIERQNNLTGQQQRILSFSQKVVAGTLYTFVIYDTGTVIDRVVLEAPQIPATATDTEIDVLNAASGQPAMDFYLTPTNSGIVGATPIGTLAFLQAVAARRIATGDYEITVTAAGDPSNVLLKSQSFNLPAAKYSSFVIAANEGADNNPISVVALGDSSQVFINVLAPASLRVINSALDQAPRDVAVDGQFSPPLFSAVPFATKTAYASVPISAALKINVTPAGNPGVLELDSTLPTGPTTLNTVLIGGPPGTLTQVNFAEDNRRIPTIGKLQFYNSAPQVLPSIDFFVVPTGTTDLTRFLPYASLLSPGGSGQLPVVPGTYDLILEQTGTTTVVAGPIPITINGGGLYSVLATNNANGVSADVKLLDDFP